MDHQNQTNCEAATLLKDELSCARDIKHEYLDSNLCEKTEVIRVKSEQTNMEKDASHTEEYSDEETYTLACHDGRTYYNKMDDCFDIKEESLEPGHSTSSSGCNLNITPGVGQSTPTLNKDDDLEKQRLTQIKNDTLLCDHCNRQFSTKNVLVDHVKSCNVYPHEKVYSYVSSRKSYTQRKKVDVHRCAVCEKEFAQQCNLKVHMRTHTGERPYACNICDARFTQAVILRNHVQTHSDDKPYQCEICKKKYKIKKHLHDHLKIHAGGAKPKFQCEYCNKWFSRRYYLRRHTNLHTGKDLLECDVCHRKFVHLRLFKTHVKSHEKKPYECDVCNVKFSHKNSFTKHKTIHFLRDSFKYLCDHCDLTFESKLALCRHIRDLNIYPHNKLPLESPKPRSRLLDRPGPRRKGDLYECAVCNKKFSNRKDFARHVRDTHMGEKPFTCTICKKPFARKHHLKDHMRVHSSEDRYECSVCDKTYTTKKGLTDHLPSHTEKRLRCDICHKKFLLVCTLNSHILTHRNDTDETLRCNHCGHKFKSKSKLSNHIVKFNVYPHAKPGESKTLVPSHVVEDLIKKVMTKKHSHPMIPMKTAGMETIQQQAVCIKTENSDENTKTKLEPRASLTPNSTTTKSTTKNEKQCPVCFKVMSQKNDLRIHMKIHTGERPFVCTVCDKKFQLRKTLKIHLRTHTGEKPYQCHVCEKRLSSLSTLNSHLVSHTGAKPFQCDVCEKGYASKSSLSNHVISHRKDKMFKCNVCSKRFARAHSLKQHMRRHLGDKRYACNLCDCKYVDNTHLKRHLLTHGNREKPHACNMCDRKYLTKNHLKRHLLTHA